MPLSDCQEIAIDTSVVEDYEKPNISKCVEIEFSCNMDKKAIRNLVKAIGLYWMTNNWRKLQGFPMRRRKRK